MRSTQRLQLLLSAGLAGLLLTALPVGLDGSTFSLTPTQAWAGSDHGIGHGNAGGHGNGTANGHANLASDDESQGSTASSLGALNAAHASDTALDNASPNSRVGKIAAYRDAALAAKTADQAVADRQADLDAANQTVADDTQALADAQKALDDANALNADADPANDVDQATIDALTTDRDTAQTDLDAANLAAADAAQALAAAQAAAATADETRDDALAAAANKPITDEVVDAVNELLGID
jgi:hypothetical protein